MKKCIFILAIVFFLVMVITISFKAGFHMDEVLSYSLANTEKYPFQEMISYTPMSRCYDIVSVDNAKRFDYKNVYKNQSLDVHPPLYYILLHTICSLFPKSFSLWYAAIINIVFALATLYIFYKLSFFLTNDFIVTYIFSITFIASIGILSAITFLRMYVMAMFFITYFSYLLIAHNINKRYVSLLIITILGALTHYYCILYTILIVTFYSCYLVYKKQLKTIIHLEITMIMAGLISLLIFPSMLYHIFKGIRGKEAWENIACLSDSLQRIQFFSSLFNNQIFGGLLPYIFIVIIILMGILYYKKNRLNNFAFIFILLLSSICYFLIISKSVPYEDERYLIPIYAISLITLLTLLYQCLIPLFSIKKIYFILIFITICILIGCYVKGNFSYLYRETIPIFQNIEKQCKGHCISIYHPQQRSLKMDGILSLAKSNNIKSITFLSIEHLNFLKQWSMKYPSFILSINSMGNSDLYVENVILSYLSQKKYKKIGEYMGYHFYFISN